MLTDQPVPVRASWARRDVLPVYLTCMFECISPENKCFSKTARAISLASCSSKLGCFFVFFFPTIQRSGVWLMSALRRERGSLSSSGGSCLSSLGGGVPGCTSSCCRMFLRVGAESRATARVFFFFFLLLPLFASRTQLPHLTFSIWPLPRGEIARVSKGGRHTS